MGKLAARWGIGGKLSYHHFSHPFPTVSRIENLQKVGNTDVGGKLWFENDFL